MRKILIILAAYNGKPWLVSQLRSLLDQEGVDLRVLIGDDCSTDGCVDSLNINLHDERVQILRFAESSGSAGQNFLRILAQADLAGFDYVAFSDQDDLWHKNKLERGIDMVQSKNADGYSSSVTAFWPDGREQVLSQSPNITDLDFLFEGAGQGCTFVLRGDFARQVQQFVCRNQRLLNGIHYHDWLVYAVSRAMGKCWVFDPEPSMRYRQHGGNDTGARGAFVGVKKRLGLIRNGWYVEQVRQMIAVVSALNANALPSDFSAVWYRTPGIVRRLQLAVLLLARGRRRALDRAVLAVSSLLGWI
ncbi:glycosyltransferase [[Pseudomonas] boreopolis]|uniref:glycosyltransferase n=1 Tax=Xanthomonas boreopolis TaxID=86183 RepID=UPI003D9BE558